MKLCAKFWKRGSIWAALVFDGELSPQVRENGYDFGKGCPHSAFVSVAS